MDEKTQSGHEDAERGAGIRRVLVVFYCYKFFGRRVARALVFLLLTCAYPFLKEPRKNSRNFLAHAEKITGKKLSSFQHILAFSYALLDKIAAWGGKITFENLHIANAEDFRELHEGLSRGQGAFLICSHLGNIELLRAAFSSSKKAENVHVNIIMSTEQTAVFNSALKRINKHAGNDMLSVHAIGMETSVLMDEKIRAGELVIMAGDRSYDNSHKNMSPQKFMGEDALFPDGTFRFAYSLGCPVFAVFLTADGADAHTLHLVKMQVPADAGSKRVAASAMQKQFSEILESLTLRFPYQWFNFYDFWIK